MLIVSACLAGINCKYNGGNSLNKAVENLVSEGEAVLVCPEQLGGCTTPRPTVELCGGTGSDVLCGRAKALRNNGDEVTEEFIKGAKEVLKIARLVGAKKAILKANSPSCGCGHLYDGTFSGKLVLGNGVTAQVLIDNGVEVITENELKP